MALGECFTAASTARGRNEQSDIALTRLSSNGSSATRASHRQVVQSSGVHMLTLVIFAVFCQVSDLPKLRDCDVATGRVASGEKTVGRRCCRTSGQRKAPAERVPIRGPARLAWVELHVASVVAVDTHNGRRPSLKGGGQRCLGLVYCPRGPLATCRGHILRLGFR